MRAKRWIIIACVTEDFLLSIKEQKDKKFTNEIHMKH